MKLTAKGIRQAHVHVGALAFALVTCGCSPQASVPLGVSELVGTYTYPKFPSGVVTLRLLASQRYEQEIATEAKTWTRTGKWEVQGISVVAYDFWISMPIPTTPPEQSVGEGWAIQWEARKAGGRVYLLGGDTVDPDSYVHIYQTAPRPLQ